MPEPIDSQDGDTEDSSGPSPVRHGHGRRASDNLFRTLQKYWAILSFLLTMGIGMLVYIHSTDMAQVHALQAGDEAMMQQRSLNLQRLAIVEERTARLERALEGQDNKLDAILKAVQWQQETMGKRR